MLSGPPRPLPARCRSSPAAATAPPWRSTSPGGRGGRRRRPSAAAALPDRGRPDRARGPRQGGVRRGRDRRRRLQPRQLPPHRRHAGPALRAVPEPDRLQGRHRRHRHRPPHRRDLRRPPDLHRRHADARVLRRGLQRHGRHHLLLGRLQLRPRPGARILQRDAIRRQGDHGAAPRRLLLPVHGHPRPPARLRRLRDQGRRPPQGLRRRPGPQPADRPDRARRSRCSARSSPNPTRRRGRRRRRPSGSIGDGLRESPRRQRACRSGGAAPLPRPPWPCRRSARRGCRGGRARIRVALPSVVRCRLRSRSMLPLRWTTSSHSRSRPTAWNSARWNAWSFGRKAAASRCLTQIASISSSTSSAGRRSNSREPAVMVRATSHSRDVRRNCVSCACSRSIGDDEGAGLGVDDHESLLFQPKQRVPDRGLADAEAFRQGRPRPAACREPAPGR